MIVDGAASQSVMEGRGAYNANAALQSSAAGLALPFFERAAAEAPIDGDGPVVVVDYGASQGRNSLAPMRVAVHALRKRLGPGRAICVVHTDLPANDFSALFATIEGASESYVEDDPNVFPSAVGRSFYRAVTPDDYVTLGWSSYAAQWLSRVPTPVPGHIVAFRSAGGVRQAFADRGRRDWETFLYLRARELRRAGCFVVCLPSLDENGSHPSAILFDAANAVIDEMVAEGAIAADERERICVAAYPRTPDETLAPFAEGGSRVGLRLIDRSFLPLEDGGWRQYQADGDATGLAARRAAFFRATFGPSLGNALKQSGDEAARSVFADRLEAGMRRRLAALLEPIAHMVAILWLAKI